NVRIDGPGKAVETEYAAGSPGSLSRKGPGKSKAGEPAQCTPRIIPALSGRRLAGIAVKRLRGDQRRNGRREEALLRIRRLHAPLIVHFQFLRVIRFCRSYLSLRLLNRMRHIDGTKSKPELAAPMEPSGGMSFGDLSSESCAGRQQQVVLRGKKRRIHDGVNLLSSRGIRGIYWLQQTRMHQALAGQRGIHPFQIGCTDGSAPEGKRGLQDRVKPGAARHPLGMPRQLHHRKLFEPFELSRPAQGACQTVRAGIQLIADLLPDFLARPFLPDSLRPSRLRGLAPLLWLEFDREIDGALPERGRSVDFPGRRARSFELIEADLRLMQRGEIAV